MLKNQRTFAHALYHIRACVVLHNMTLGVPQDTFWSEEELVRLQKEWELEATAISSLMDPDGVAEQREERGEALREILRTRFEEKNWLPPTICGIGPGLLV